MIGRIISQYRILEKLGEGGMGVVYLAEDTVLGRRVAFKSLKDSDRPDLAQYRTRFLREARLASTLNHPNIVSIYDYGETPDGMPYLVMEYVRGRNLADLLREKKLPVAEGLDIIKQIARALAEAHEHGIVHRDLKPSNVFVNERGDVKVLDFGLAKVLDAALYDSKTGSASNSELLTETREGVFIGTPSYSSPEQLLGAGVDRRSDIFSLGAVFYECLSGQPAFAGRNFAEICAQVIRDDPPPPSKLNLAVSPEYDEVALKALSKRAENRYQTVEELIRDLETAPGDAPTEEITTGGGRPPEKSAEPPSAVRSERSPVTGFLKKNVVLTGVFVLLALIALAFAASGSLRNLFRPAASTETPASFNEGVAALRSGNYYKAKKLLENAVRENDRFPLAHARLAEALNELGYEDGATKEILKVTELTPTFPNLSEIDRLNLQGTAAAVRRNFDGALENYRQIVEKSPESEKKFAYFDLGRVCEAADDTDRAIENYAEATARDPNFAAAFLRLGMLYGRQQDAAKAAAAFDRAENLYNAQSDYDGLAEVAYQRGYLLNIQDKLPAAAEKMKRANELAAMTKNASLEVRSLLHLSSIAYSADDQAAAKNYADQAIELARVEELDNLATVALIDTGNIFFMRGRLTEAENNFTLALRRAKTNEWPRVEARAGLSLGSLYLQQTKSADAIPLIEAALDFYRRNNFRKEMLQAQLALGYANDQAGNYDAAVRAFTDQLRAAEEADDKLLAFYTRAALGLALIHQEKFADALAEYDRSLELSRALGLESKSGYSLLNRGQALWQLGRYRESREALDAAAAIAGKPESGDRQLLAWTHLVRAQSALSEENYRAAADESRKAVELSGAQSGEIYVQAAFTEGLAAARSGAAAKGRDLCRKAADAAVGTGMAHLLLKSKMALVETLLANGEAQPALDVFLELQKGFSETGNLLTRWRGYALAAQAAARLGDEPEAREYRTRADEISAALESNLGPENYRSFLSRMDVGRLKK
ncbi:MAG: protein kinase [Acidobacteria bacterium]|nr:protein kinase [Acidobacteriota bacterium]